MAFGGGFVEKRRRKEGRRRLAKRLTKVQNPRATHKAQNPYYEAMILM